MPPPLREAANSNEFKLQSTRAEVVLKLGWDEKWDVWSLGCVLVALLTGKFLFDEKSENKLLKKIGKV